MDGCVRVCVCVFHVNPTSSSTTILQKKPNNKKHMQNIQFQNTKNCPDLMQFSLAKMEMQINNLPFRNHVTWI